MMFIKLIIFINFYLNLVNSNEEILGCGGFIKSDVQLDFSRVQIKLYTKQNVLKDTTDCAPNNGYYFIPLYDKGDYILKAEPPTGWSFDKTEIQLSIDGKTDPCSLGKDINFNFKGFGITGKVISANSNIGPAGVKIAYNENGKIRETFTTDGGNFHFTPVIPGKYKIIASHPKWKFLKNEITVEVKQENTELPKDSFIVAGYDVTGSIVANNEPIDGVHIALINPKLKQVPVDCSVDQIVDFKSNLGKPICNIVSKNGGKIYFSILPPGDYKLIPFYKYNGAIFDIQPSSTSITVGHNSVVLDTIFQLVGVTLNGRILLVGDDTKTATVLLNGQEITTTNKNGFYTLNNVLFGTYQISALAENVKYPILEIEINSKSYSLPTLKPNAYKSCGQVISNNEYTVIYELQPNNDIFNIKTDPKQDGNYCIYLPSGQYHVKVETNSNDPANVQFFPLYHSVEIIDSPPSNIVFSQLKATVNGAIVCFNSNECEGLQVELRSTSTGSTQHYKTVSTNGKYQFKDIPPGRYEVSIIGIGLCWENTKYYIAINSAEAVVSTFKQTGYKITFSTSHETQIHYELLTDNNSVSHKGVIVNPAGVNTHCLKRAGRYRFTGVSCHGYEPKFVEWSTSTRSNMATPVTFNAVSHAHGVQVIVNDDTAKISIDIKSENSNQILYTLEPIKITTITKTRIVHEFQLQIGEQNIVIVQPRSKTVLFQPKFLRIVGGTDCIQSAGEIIASKGKIIEGKIIPPLSGVKVTVSANNEEIMQLETKADGKFHFGPLDDSIQYVLSAVKENYFIDDLDKNGNFIAHKMADITINAIDQDTKIPLSGVLVSVSGDSNYRKNLQTNNEGRVQFTSLNPGEYFMRPMMKEYRFDPISKMLSVKEGESFRLKVVGKRVAFSGYGVVRTLAGSGEAGVIVEARSTTTASECNNHVEQATTDATGAFRIRGLIPGCSYHLKLKQLLHSDDDRSFGQMIENIQNDLHDIQLICLQPPAYMDVNVHVYTDKPEFYRSLRVKLGYGDQLANPIQSVRLDPQIVGTRKQLIPEPGVLVVFNSIPYDNKQYYVQLDSSLSQASYNFDTNPVYFVANTSFKHIYLNFNPKTKVTEYDMNQTTMFALPLLFLIGLIVYNTNYVLYISSNFFNNIYQQLTNNNLTQSSGKTFNNSSDYAQNDYAEIDQIVQNINAVKQKSKKRVMLIS